MNKLDLSNPKDRTFARILERQAAEAGSTVFLRTDDVAITFAEAESITNRLASGLSAHGLVAGDRVALYMSNQPEMVLLALAINKLSAVWVPINRDYKGQWLEDTVARCRAKILFTDCDGVAEIQRLNLDLKALTLGVVGPDAEPDTIAYQALLDAPEYSVDHDSQSFGDTCAILWTSGTTGRSKGVMQPYNAWVHAIVNGASMQYQSRDGDIIYNVLPLFNAGGWITAVLRALLEGITVVIEQRFSVTQFWDRIAHFGATQTFALGAMGTFLLNEPEKPDDAATPLREAQIVPLAPDLWPVFSQRFGVRLIRGGAGAK